MVKICVQLIILVKLVIMAMRKMINTLDHPPHQASSLQSPEEELDTELVWAQLLSSREQVGYDHIGHNGQPDHPHHVSHLVLFGHVQLPSSWKQVTITFVVLIAYGHNFCYHPSQLLSSREQVTIFNHPNILLVILVTMFILSISATTTRVTILQCLGISDGCILWWGQHENR